MQAINNFLIPRVQLVLFHSPAFPLSGREALAVSGERANHKTYKGARRTHIILVNS